MIATKLHTPDISVSAVSRPDIIDKLNKGLNQKLVLISAPAGYGKTTALSQWILQTEIPSAWICMDKPSLSMMIPFNIFKYVKAR